MRQSDVIFNVKFISFLSSVILLIITGFHFQKENISLSGMWNLSLITLNTDTIFYRGKPEYSYQYNYLLHNESIKSKVDSLDVLKIAKDKFSKNESMKITFQKDSTFIMTKMRGGGRVYPMEKDTGTYTIRGDTIFMINRTRNNYKQCFVISKSGSKIYFYDGFPEYMVYFEYKKEE